MRHLARYSMLLVLLGWVGWGEVQGEQPQANQDTLVLPLWEGDVPGSLGTEEKDRPVALVTLLKSDEPSPLLVICPGGGYGGLAMDHEGKQIAEWAIQMGMSALICDYRHRGKGYGHPYPLMDAQRAIRLARHHASDWKIDAQRVGIIGFSAGGHLASTVLTHFDDGDPNASDPIDRHGSRPDFGILCYPVIALNQPFTHRGSQNNLLGPNPDPEWILSLSNERQVTEKTPPVFLFHTAEDTAVPVENSIVFYAAMAEKKVPGELHVFAKGRHGVGLAKDIPATREWPNLCQHWLTTLGILK